MRAVDNSGYNKYAWSIYLGMQLMQSLTNRWMQLVTVGGVTSRDATDTCEADTLGHN